MFEDMLAYEPRTFLAQPFSELLAADLDDDARQFYARMVADITVVATGVGRRPHPTEIGQTLLEALVAAPTVSATFWRQLYLEISVLVAGCALDSVAEDHRPKLVGALGRLRQFLCENVDLAEQLIWLLNADAPNGSAPLPTLSCRTDARRCPFQTRPSRN